MSRQSAFISDKARPHYKNEFHFYIVFGITLALCGLMLLAIPIVSRGAVIAFMASWLLFIAAVLALVRPAMFGRGLPDFVLALITAIFYGFTGYITGGSNLINIEGYRLALCAVIFFAGLSRLLVFARMLSVAPMPMQLLCCVADIISSVLLLWGYPDDRASVIYWYAGMLTLVDGAEAMTEAVALNRYVGSEPQEEDLPS